MTESKAQFRALMLEHEIRHHTNNLHTYEFRKNFGTPLDPGFEAYERRKLEQARAELAALHH